jgi:hypothetical protein
MLKLKVTLTGISLGAALAIASPAWATSTVAIDGPCSDLADGIGSSCKFSGNINTNDTGNESYTVAEDVYNDYAATQGWGPIDLNPLADFSGSGSQNGITLTLNATGDGGTFTLDPGVVIDYYAVKAANGFLLFEQYTGNNSFSTLGLAQNTRGDQTPGLSHIIFFGSNGGVPEPATWAMMLLGIGMVGSSMRRRQKAQSAIRQLA